MDSPTTGDWKPAGDPDHRTLIVRGVKEGQQSRQKGHHLARSQTPNSAHAEDQNCQHPTGRRLFFSFSRLCSIAGPGLSSRQQGQPAARLYVTVHIWSCGELCVGTGESPERREKYREGHGESQGRQVSRPKQDHSEVLPCSLVSELFAPLGLFPESCPPPFPSLPSKPPAPHSAITRQADIGPKVQTERAIPKAPRPRHNRGKQE
ncbi:hypothetical protein CSPX01_07890 [Colletotrichum filicis]|nr:hypothetical protein CSPX01_07890 [Colletotrichum filicis]